ncbi:SH3 domain-containing protein [Enterobacteriaceae bacterium RIT691]|nr:SH3 domain-containing protein [Enterobacteriaceae bacterium RIT691]
MKLRNLLSLLVVTVLVGCKAPEPPINDNTLVTSQVNGVTLIHRHIVAVPKEFTPINDSYRALYAGSVLSTPDFGGKVLSELENGHTYTVLGSVENGWLAIAEDNQKEMLGYVPSRALVKSELYAQTLKKDRPRRKAAGKKATCVSVDSNSKACQKADSGTWIIN